MSNLARCLLWGALSYFWIVVIAPSGLRNSFDCFLGVLIALFTSIMCLLPQIIHYHHFTYMFFGLKFSYPLSVFIGVTLLLMYFVRVFYIIYKGELSDLTKLVSPNFGSHDLLSVNLGAFRIPENCSKTTCLHCEIGFVCGAYFNVFLCNKHPWISINLPRLPSQFFPIQFDPKCSSFHCTYYCNSYCSNFISSVPEKTARGVNS